MKIPIRDGGFVEWQGAVHSDGPVSAMADGHTPGAYLCRSGLRGGNGKFIRAFAKKRKAIFVSIGTIQSSLVGSAWRKANQIMGYATSNSTRSLPAKSASGWVIPSGPVPFTNTSGEKEKQF